MANIYAAFGISFDLLLGYTGLAVLGFGLFVGIGAYTSAFLNLYLGMPPWLTMPISGLIGALFGIIIGIPCLRLKGLYLALASFAAAGICEKLVIVFNSITFGREGLSGLDPISFSKITNYYTSLILLLVSTGILLWIVKSKIGLILKSICDDEAAAEAVGVNTNRYKLFTFVISSFMGGFWGSFLAHYMMHVGPGVFGFHTAITIFMVTVVGGLGTIIGPVGGAYLLIIMNEMLREIGEVRLLIYAVITIIIYLLLPHGIVQPGLEFLSAGLRKISHIFNIRKWSFGNDEIPRS
ncbi:MAG: branched-chain amino acid ABC transporter permease [Deltaproteobacteria bacterium]|nr:branched-chain amino acid ABC transporter permease [Deltaproteobacteria bacterium]